MSTAPAKPLPAFAPGWDQARWNQLFTLQDLLNEVSMLNRGTGTIERLQRCIAMAEELRCGDLVTSRASLPRFLMERALAGSSPCSPQQHPAKELS